jgi:hypothetical protein
MQPVPLTCRNVLVIRDCQPGPLALHLASTSFSIRRATCCRFEPIGRPGFPRRAARAANASVTPASDTSKSSGSPGSALSAIVSLFAIIASPYRDEPRNRVPYDINRRPHPAIYKAHDLEAFFAVHRAHGRQYDVIEIVKDRRSEAQRYPVLGTVCDVLRWIERDIHFISVDAKTHQCKSLQAVVAAGR